MTPHEGPPPVVAPASAGLGRTVRFRTVLALGAAVLVVAVVGFVVLIAGSEPGTPRAAAQEYVDADISGDWERAWELLCRDSQRDEGPRERFVEERAAEMNSMTLVAPDLDVRVGPARHDEESSSYHVDVFMTGGDLPVLVDVTVVEEDGRFRVCGLSG